MLAIYLIWILLLYSEYTLAELSDFYIHVCKKVSVYMGKYDTFCAQCANIQKTGRKMLRKYT